MRIAVISDTHLRHGQQVIDELWSQLDGADRILHAGDVVHEEVIEMLGRIAPVIGVAGNMDSAGVRKLWPVRRVIELGCFRAGMSHGSGPPERLPERVTWELAQHFGPLDVVIFGHTHQPLIQRVGGVLLINPGSPTDRRDAPYRSFAWLHVDDDRVDAELVPLERAVQSGR